MERNLLILLSFLFLVSSCKITNEEDRVVEIDPVFSIDLIQDLTQFGRLNVIVNSTELQDCKNYSISIDWNRTPTNIDLDLIEITPPSDCIVGGAFAESIVQLGNIGNNRTFNLKIGLQDAVENSGKLIINNKSYLIEMDTWDGLGFVRHELLKVPTNTVWGYVAYETESVAGQLSEDFLTDIRNLGEELILEEGYYGFFNINATNKIGVINPPSLQFVKHFLISYTGAIDNLESLVNDYKMGTNGNDIEIKVQVWNGVEF